MFERVYHPVHLWEEIPANMWGNVSNKKEFLAKAISLTGDHKAYGKYMRKVVQEWQYSCENALTDQNLNKRAWVGHAACAMALGCPEDITREAWKHLNKIQQERANAEADHAIKLWGISYAERKNIKLHTSMEVSLL